MRNQTVSAASFAAATEEAVQRVAREQTAAVAAAADLVVGGLRAGGVVQAFGTGHSQALAMELSGRAGGLVPTNMIALRDLVLLGGEPPELLFTSTSNAIRPWAAGSTTSPGCRRRTCS